MLPHQERKIRSKDLLELLDLEERSLLAEKLGINPPTSLKDKPFATQISEFSVTTLMGNIIDLRRPLLQMLSEVYAFLRKQQTMGKTTARAILLPSDTDNYLLSLEPSIEKAIATSLQINSSATRDAIYKRIQNTNLRVDELIQNVRGTVIEEFAGFDSYQFNRESVKNAFRGLPAPPRKNFSRLRKELVYSEADIVILHDLKESYSALFSLINRLNAAASLQDWYEAIERISTLIDQKLLDITSQTNKNASDNKGGQQTIDSREFSEIIEEIKNIRENVIAISEIQNVFETIYDLLALHLWRERWRIYELWILISIIDIFVSAGFVLDLSARTSGNIWNMKFARDTQAIARLIGSNISLDVFYQLYSKNANSGDMPDIAVKIHDGDFLLIFDPKYGRTYQFTQLVATALRYYNGFNPVLTVIHNFYRMPNYDYEVWHRPRMVVASDVTPNSNNWKTLVQEILSVIPSQSSNHS